jgi:uncharacterized protein YecT (DUF1311 family)
MARTLRRRATAPDCPIRLRAALAQLLAIVLLVVPAGLRAQPSNIRLWRITAMIPEPWTDAASLPAAARGLVQTGLAFLDDRVKGPPPLACDKPAYRDRPVSVAELFAGRVPDDRLDEVAKRLGIGDVQGFAFQVVCGATVMSYFWVGPDRLVRVGDAIYRIEPRDSDAGVDPDEWVRKITPGFDCDKAATTAERLICTDFETATADRQISERYAALRGEETKESFATIQATQRAWLRYTPAACGADGPMPEDQFARRDMLNCLREAYTAWRDAFAGLSVQRAGTLAIEPRLHILTALHPRQRIDWIAYPWMTGMPAATATAFNRAVGAMLAPQASYLTKERITEPEADYPISAWRTYTLHNFDDRLVSLFVWGQVYGGGAHEGLIEQAINFDVERARPAGPADFFRAGSRWRESVAAFCLKDLLEQLEPAEGEGPSTADVEREVANAAAWLFEPGHAVVHFATYTVTSFAGGPQEVEIPYGALRPYLRPDAPLPSGIGR